MRLFHGSPSRDVRRFTNHSFFTEHRWVAERYACDGIIKIVSAKRSGPSVYEVEVDVGPTEILDLRSPLHMKLYEDARKAWNATLADGPDDPFWLPGLRYAGFIMPHTGLPTHGWVRPIHAAMPAFAAMWVDEGTMPKSLLVFDAARVTIVARHDVDCAHGA